MQLINVKHHADHNSIEISQKYISRKSNIKQLSKRYRKQRENQPETEGIYRRATSCIV